MFDTLAERKKIAGMVYGATMNSVHAAGLMLLAILAIAGLAYGILLLHW
jgi:hypothetical protein